MSDTPEIDWEHLRLDTEDQWRAFARMVEKVGREAAAQAWEETQRLEAEARVTAR